MTEPDGPLGGGDDMPHCGSATCADHGCQMTEKHCARVRTPHSALNPSNPDSSSSRDLAHAADIALDGALRKAAIDLDDFAWSAVTTDCQESHDYLKSLLANLHSALSRDILADRLIAQARRNQITGIVTFIVLTCDDPQTSTPQAVIAMGVKALLDLDMWAR